MDSTTVSNVVFDKNFIETIAIIGGILLALIIVLVINRDKKEKK
jgi:hypothetical protein